VLGFRYMTQMDVMHALMSSFWTYLWFPGVLHLDLQDLVQDWIHQALGILPPALLLFIFAKDQPYYYLLMVHLLYSCHVTQCYALFLQLLFADFHQIILILWVIIFLPLMLGVQSLNQILGHPSMLVFMAWGLHRFQDLGTWHCL